MLNMVVRIIDKKTKVIRLLKENPAGLTIVDIANALGISRHTVAIVLAELRGADKIKIKEMGMAKLHYLKEDKDEISYYDSSI